MSDLQFDSRDHCRRILEELPAAVITLDPDGYINGLNCSAGQMLGYGTEDLHDQPIETILPDGKWFTRVKRNIQNKSSHREAMELITADDNKIPVTLSLSAITDDSGELTEFVLVAEEPPGSDDPEPDKKTGGTAYQ